MHRDGADPTSIRETLFELGWVTKQQIKSFHKKRGELCFAHLLIREGIITRKQLRTARKHRSVRAKAIDVECAMCEIRGNNARIGDSLISLDELLQNAKLAKLKGKTR